MSEPAKSRATINWWKSACIVSLIAFEVVRELLVLEVNEPKQLLGPSLSIYGGDGFAHAEGVWMRSDGGSPITQGSVVIDCYQQWNSCIEVNNSFLPDIPALNTFVDVQAIESFSDDAVVFSNQSRICAKYRVRLDLAQKRVIATRDRKANADSELCESLEDRVAMELRSGSATRPAGSVWTEKHFLPLYRVLMTFLD